MGVVLRELYGCSQGLLCLVGKVKIASHDSVVEFGILCRKLQQEGVNLYFHCRAFEDLP